MLWQRKIELEREMNDVLDPGVGGDVVGAMKKEIHRMQLRAGELARIQESLLLDLERSIAKRDHCSQSKPPKALLTRKAPLLR